MSFSWTPELQDETPPFRGEGKPIAARKIDAVKLLSPVATSLAPQRAPDYRPRASLVALATTGNPGAFADEADALIVLGSTGQKGSFAGQITMVSEPEATKVVFPGVDRWVQVHGLVGALEIFSLLGAWKPYDLMAPGQTIRLARKRMRQHLAHAPDYAAALAKAEALLAAGFPSQRGKTYDGTAEVLAYVFPDHRPFFARAIAAIVGANWVTSYLLAAVTTVDEYRQIPSLGAADVDENATVIARSLHEAGLPILLELAAIHPKSASVALALTAYTGPEAADALALFAEHKALHKIVIPYFQRDPALARRALGAHAKAKRKALRENTAKVLAAIG